MEMQTVKSSVYIPSSAKTKMSMKERKCSKTCMVGQAVTMTEVKRNLREKDLQSVAG